MITTLSGSNDYQIDIELKNILNNFRTSHGEFGIEQIDGSEADYQTIFEVVSGLSLLAPKKLVVLRHGSGNKSFIDSIDKVIANVPQTTDLVIVEPNLDKRLSYYKSLKKLTDFRNYDEPELGQLVRWIEKLVKDNSGSISPSGASYLIEVAGSNQMRLSNEILKLIGHSSIINKDTIDLLVDPLPQSTIFQLLDVAFAGRSGELFKIYDDQKKQKIEPQQILAMLTWQIHIIALIKASKSSSSSEIAAQTKINPFVINKSMNMAKKLSLKDVRSLTNRLLELDVKLKNQSVDADEALLQLLLSIAV